MSRKMLCLAVALSAVPGLAGTARAAAPVTLADAQLDRITAGALSLSAQVIGLLSALGFPVTLFVAGPANAATVATAAPTALAAPMLSGGELVSSSSAMRMSISGP